MLKKINEKRLFKIMGLLTFFIFHISYSSVALFMPAREYAARKFILVILLAIASFHDIREQKVPLWVCAAIFGINVIHSVMVYKSVVQWIIGFILLAALMALYFLNRNLIGLGDILLVTSCVQSLRAENTMKFLFLTFAFASLSGIFKCIRNKSFNSVSVPLSPCVAAAFILLI
ncbi:type IV leader peptidase family [Thermoclostridium stercorarium subsp. stercorarium DSM 8532]|uniref:Type IV leader peptidase family n=3 Tax=Thermoclostridium stercorarium TaxID=1510 RepID=L7VP18_THES1|nr:prepilin peptidase [Thermoclostridium stercorarium]AGC68424.1 type IV leader peptidase family [Thermoclostridium stercorarium subsp. stercorarium DSM 8532]AGI39444.1 peptidase [Thermoclostridium stercorarium subsp. stercorarium DSM 8532]ANX01298.1 peptidase [Thermoclostridium stercorarium subsp. leptospartum DSM 9219]UZQ84422.1 prepilin peptidase [Thermoclostridium stercorarium]